MSTLGFECPFLKAVVRAPSAAVLAKPTQPADDPVVRRQGAGRNSRCGQRRMQEETETAQQSGDAGRGRS